MDNKYLCKFDEKGYRHETYLACEYTDEQKADMIANGFVEIDEDEWKLYCEESGQKYIRIDGKPTLAPPHIPTKEEKLSQLEAEYEQESAELEKYYNKANIKNDTDLMAELREEMSDLEAEYEAKRKEIEEAE
jgi:hypothetical protein